VGFSSRDNRIVAPYIGDVISDYNKISTVKLAVYYDHFMINFLRTEPITLLQAYEAIKDLKPLIVGKLGVSWIGPALMGDSFCIQIGLEEETDTTSFPQSHNGVLIRYVVVGKF
jgi:cephalosporin hydroxylase